MITFLITSLFMLFMFFVFFMLFNPEITILGITEGLKVWYSSLIPSLFPFMLISNIIISLNSEEIINKLLRPLTYVLGIEKNAGFAIFSGLFFGYPLCCLTSIRLYRVKKISAATANFCTACFNNLSPAFLVGCLGHIKAVLPIHFLTIGINVLINRLRWSKELKKAKDISTANPIIITASAEITKYNSIFDGAILDSIISITKLGGYIAFFSLINEYIKLLFTNITNVSTYICLIVEITTGINTAGSIRNILPFVSFTGICGILQTFAIDDTKIINRKKYITSKIQAALICIIISRIPL